MSVDMLNVRDWLYHYEVIVMRHGREQILARVPSRFAAERTIARARRGLEINRQNMQWRRVRGVHPWKAVVLCTLPLLVVLMLPWLWVRAGVGIVCLSIILGLLSSGARWMQGGEDDR